MILLLLKIVGEDFFLLGFYKVLRRAAYPLSFFVIMVQRSLDTYRSRAPTHRLDVRMIIRLPVPFWLRPVPGGRMRRRLQLPLYGLDYSHQGLGKQRLWE